MRIIDKLSELPLFVRILITLLSFKGVGYFYAKSNKEMPDLTSFILLGIVTIIFLYGFVSVIKDWKKGGIKYIISRLFKKEN